MQSPPHLPLVQIWEEGCSSEAGAVRLYSGEIVGGLAEGLASQQWGRKKACAQAISALAQVCGGKEGCA